MNTTNDQSNDFDSLARRYASFSEEDLLIELQRLIAPAQFKEEPSDDERKREGKALWIRLREKCAILLCRDRQKGGDKRVNALVAAGIGAFVKQMGQEILGSGFLPDVTTALAAATAALLFKDLQAGLDRFCSAYYPGEPEE